MGYAISINLLVEYKDVSKFIIDRYRHQIKMYASEMLLATK